MLPKSSLAVNEHLDRHHRRYVIYSILTVVIIVVAVTLLKHSSSPLQNIIQKKPSSVEIKTTYKNPFDKNTQYANPFDRQKNPFVTNR